MDPGFVSLTRVFFQWFIRWFVSLVAPLDLDDVYNKCTYYI